MWVFSEIGFFSAVENYFETDNVLVRGRFKQDLENLQQVIKEQEGLVLEIMITSKHDYHYRLNVPKVIWGRVCQGLAEGITYHNFKNHVHGKSDRDRAYMECWVAMDRVQE